MSSIVNENKISYCNTMLDRPLLVPFTLVLWSFLLLQHRLVISFQEETVKGSIENHDKEATIAGSRSIKLRHKRRHRALDITSPRIINGVETERSRQPYVALLTAEHILKCGGSVSHLLYIQMSLLSPTPTAHYFDILFYR
jgi:hypothetical protein